MGVVQESAHLHCLGFAWLQGISFAIKMAHFLAVSVQNLGEEAERARLGILIPYLRFCIHRYLLSCNIIVAAIDIDTCGLEIIVERKSLVKFVGDVEEHILWNTAIVGIEVLVVPLETSTEAPQEAAKSSNTGVIVGIAAAVVLLGGGAAIVAKKKKS